MSSCNGNLLVPGKYIITSWQNRMLSCMGDTIIAGDMNQETEKQIKIIAICRQPLRQPSPMRTAKARKRHLQIIFGCVIRGKAADRMICDNQNERGCVQLTAYRHTKPACQLVVDIPLNLFPT